MRLSKLIFKESGDLCLHKSHESQLRNKMKENLAVKPTCIDRINPNLPDPVNFVPFGTMRYSPFDINLISIICILFVFLYFCLFLNKA